MILAWILGTSSCDNDLEKVYLQLGEVLDCIIVAERGRLKTG